MWNQNMWDFKESIANTSFNEIRRYVEFKAEKVAVKKSKCTIMHIKAKSRAKREVIAKVKQNFMQVSCKLPNQSIFLRMRLRVLQYMHLTPRPHRKLNPRAKCAYNCATLRSRKDTFFPYNTQRWYSEQNQVTIYTEFHKEDFPCITHSIEFFEVFENTPTSEGTDSSKGESDTLSEGTQEPRWSQPSRVPTLISRNSGGSFQGQIHNSDDVVPVF